MKITPHIDSRVTDPGWTLQPPEWTERALCAEILDDTLWFPGKGSNGAHLAKTVCRRCPVRRECLADAMRAESRLGNLTRQGVWGGLSPKERYQLARSGWQPGDPIPPVRVPGEAA